MAVDEWKIFAHKMTKKLDMSLQNARMEFTALRWQSFEQIMAFSHKILKQRYFIVRFTLYMLSVMAGIGWVNAAANMIQSRRKEYVVLRKLGMSEGRVKKIIWYQLVLFIFSGIVADMSLQNARMEFTALRWQSFEQIMAFSHKILKQRYFIVRFTLYMLSVMAGIGWVNAAANMIQSRRKEYVVLRKLGMSEGRVKKIIWYQLVLFIFSGIVAGIVLGIEILKIFNLREYGVRMDIKFRTENIWFILVLFLVLLVSLRKNVRENVAVQA